MVVAGEVEPIDVLANRVANVLKESDCKRRNERSNPPSWPKFVFRESTHSWYAA